MRPDEMRALARRAPQYKVPQWAIDAQGALREAADRIDALEGALRDAEYARDGHAAEVARLVVEKRRLMESADAWEAEALAAAAVNPTGEERE